MIEAFLGAVVVLVSAGVFVYIRFFRKPAPSVPAASAAPTQDDPTKR